MLRKALEIRRQSQGDRHPEYAQCLRKLAHHAEWKPEANADEALELYQQALRIDRELFGPDDLVCDADLRASRGSIATAATWNGLRGSFVSR